MQFTEQRVMQEVIPVQEVEVRERMVEVPVDRYAALLVYACMYVCMYVCIYIRMLERILQVPVS
jgi:hypothetical protein